MKLLIIEDEIDLAKTLVRGFEKKGYVADMATDGEEGLCLYNLNEYDVIVLDLNLPSMDGIEILKAIRETDDNQKVIVLSARTSIQQRIEGLDFGANDYLCKPFDFLELEARVRSLLRREIIQQDVKVKIGPIVVNTKNKSVFTTEGYKLDLPRKEYAILEFLVLNSDTVVSSETLIEHIWGDDVNPFTESVKVYISNIRKKIKTATGKDLIATIRGQGYLVCKKEI